jgi:hypothetical protein
MAVMRAFFARAVRATAILVRDKRIPRPIRWVGALALLPIPGPLDEALLLLLTPLLLLGYRRQTREAWERAGGAPRSR